MVVVVVMGMCVCVWGGVGDDGSDWVGSGVGAGDVWLAAAVQRFKDLKITVRVHTTSHSPVITSR